MIRITTDKFLIPNCFPELVTNNHLSGATDNDFDWNDKNSVEFGVYDFESRFHQNSANIEWSAIDQCWEHVMEAVVEWGDEMATCSRWGNDADTAACSEYAMYLVEHTGLIFGSEKFERETHDNCVETVGIEGECQYVTTDDT